MPREESRGTYNTGCWGQGEACLVHLGRSTEREGKRESSSQEGLDAREPGRSSVLLHPEPHCLPNSLPLQEKDVSIHRDREGGRERDTHRETVRNRDRKKKEIQIRERRRGGN